MEGFTLSVTVRRPYDATVTSVRERLAEQGFGILTEVDLAATFKAKLDVDMAPQVILGACRPALAHRALELEPSLAAVLPCNVVVRSLDATTTVVEAFDPDVMLSIADSDALRDVAEDARERLSRALAAVAAAEVA